MTENLSNQKGVAQLVILLVVVVGVILGVVLSQNPQIFRPKAFNDEPVSDVVATQQASSPNDYLNINPNGYANVYCGEEELGNPKTPCITVYEDQAAITPTPLVAPNNNGEILGTKYVKIVDVKWGNPNETTKEIRLSDFLRGYPLPAGGGSLYFWDENEIYGGKVAKICQPATNNPVVTEVCRIYPPDFSAIVTWPMNTRTSDRDNRRGTRYQSGELCVRYESNLGRKAVKCYYLSSDIIPNPRPRPDPPPGQEGDDSYCANNKPCIFDSLLSSEGGALALVIRGDTLPDQGGVYLDIRTFRLVNGTRVKDEPIQIYPYEKAALDRTDKIFKFYTTQMVGLSSLDLEKQPQLYRDLVRQQVRVCRDSAKQDCSNWRDIPNRPY